MNDKLSMDSIYETIFKENGNYVSLDDYYETVRRDYSKNSEDKSLPKFATQPAKKIEIKPSK